MRDKYEVIVSSPAPISKHNIEIRVHGLAAMHVCDTPRRVCHRIRLANGKGKTFFGPGMLGPEVFT